MPIGVGPNDPQPGVASSSADHVLERVEKEMHALALFDPANEEDCRLAGIALGFGIGMKRSSIDTVVERRRFPAEIRIKFKCVSSDEVGHAQHARTGPECCSE